MVALKEEMTHYWEEMTITAYLRLRKTFFIDRNQNKKEGIRSQNPEISINQSYRKRS